MAEVIVNQIEADVRNKKQMKSDEHSASTLSQLVRTVATSNLQTQKTLDSLNKNIANLAKNNSSSGKYSAGFDKSLYSFQQKSLMSNGNAGDMSRTNKLLEQLLNKKNPVDIINKNKNNKTGGFDITSLLPLIPLVGVALIPLLGGAVMDKLLKYAPKWVQDLLNNDETGAPGQVSNKGILASSTLNAVKLANIGMKTASGIKALDKFINTPEKLMNQAAKASAKGEEKLAEKIFEKALKREALDKVISTPEKLMNQAAKASAKGDEKLAEKIFEKALKKEASQTAEKLAEKSLPKVAAKVVGKTLGKAAAKMVPGLGATIEGYSAFESLKAGNLTGTGLHAAAAITNLFPEFGGSFASLGLGLAGDYNDLKYNERKAKEAEEAEDTQKYKAPAEAGIDSQFNKKLSDIFSMTGESPELTSGRRSHDTQMGLYNDALLMAGASVDANGTVHVGRYQVAAPGKSKHEYGLAADLKGIRDSANFITAANAQGLKAFEESKGESTWMHVQTLAKGGITNGPTSAIIGEAGREAVIPLESDEGIGALADAMRKYNKGDENSQLLSQILSVLMNTNSIPILSEINKSIQGSSTSVSVAAPSHAGGAA